MFKKIYLLPFFILFGLDALGQQQQKMFSDHAYQNAVKTLDTLTQETGYRFLLHFTQLPLPIAEVEIDTAGKTIADLFEGKFIKPMNESDSAKAFFAAQLQEVKEIVQEGVTQMRNSRNMICLNPHTGIYYYIRQTSAQGKEMEEYFQSQFIFGENIPQDLQSKISAFKPSKEIRYTENNHTAQNDTYLQEYVQHLKKCLGNAPEVAQKFTFQELTYNSTQVYDDDGTPFPTPHVKRRRRQDSPLCFVKKTRPKVSIKLTYKDALDKEKVFIKATTNYNLTMPPTKATINESTKEITLNDVNFDNDLPDNVAYWEKFIAAWYVSLDAGATWQEATKTENKLYIVLETPLKPTLLYETLLFIGCKYGHGKNNEADVFNGIWQHFAERNVKDKKGKELSYYGDVATRVTETKDLLDKRVGQCSSFAHLFLDILYAQGINTRAGEGNYVLFEMQDHSKDDDYGFLVKNWTFAPTQSSGDKEFPYQNIPFAAKTTTGELADFIRNADKTYHWIGSPEVTDLAGVAGQNNPNPASNFNNHQIIKYKGKFYDPSYGAVYENETQLSERAIEAFYKKVYVDKSEQDVDLDFDGDGVKLSIKKKYPVYFIKKKYNRFTNQNYLLHLLNMKNILIFCFLVFQNVSFAQKKQVVDQYAQKFYKFKNEIYGIKYPKKNPEAHLFCYSQKINKIKQIFPYSHFGLMSTYYPNLIYDINFENFIVLETYGREIEIGSQTKILSFFPQKEPTEQDWSKRIRTKEEISHNLTGIRDFRNMRIIKGTYYWHYDVVLQKDETLLMPVCYKDSLYVYHFTDKAWTKPDYQGVEKNEKNDKWTRISEAKHSFKTSFRSFQIENDLYFLTNSDTTIYKYEKNGLKEIGKINPTPYKRTLFLVDKDDNKVYFLMAQSIEIIAEERNRFALLKPEDELYKAVKRIIDEPDRK